MQWTGQWSMLCCYVVQDYFLNVTYWTLLGFLHVITGFHGRTVEMQVGQC
jgi:hypothetical protein